MEKLLELRRPERVLSEVEGCPYLGRRAELLASLLGLRSARRVDPAATWTAVIYAVFFNTSAEFFDPKPTQLQMAYSIWLPARCQGRSRDRTPDRALPD